MLAPGDDPERSETSRPTGRSPVPVDSDRACPWCGSEDVHQFKKMPSTRGIGLLAYIIFPIALTQWLTATTYNLCRACGGRWQRGVAIEPRIRNAAPEDAPTVRAGMYAHQVPAAAVVRRRPRLGTTAAAIATGDVVVIVPAGSCRTCRQAAGRYDARDAPPIPIPSCTCVNGCRCSVEPADAAESEPEVASTE